MEDNDRVIISKYFKTDVDSVEFYRLYQNLILKIENKQFNIKKEIPTKKCSTMFSEEDVQFLRKFAKKLLYISNKREITASDFR